MGFISLREDTVDKTIEDSEEGSATFQIKKVLSKGDVNHAFEIVMEATRNMPRREDLPRTPDAGDPQQLTLDMVLGLPSGQLAILNRAVVSWDLTFPKGHPDHPGPIPLNEEMIDQLASPVVDELCDFIKELNHVKTDEEAGNLERS